MKRREVTVLVYPWYLSRASPGEMYHTNTNWVVAQSIGVVRSLVPEPPQGQANFRKG